MISSFIFSMASAVLALAATIWHPSTESSATRISPQGASPLSSKTNFTACDTVVTAQDATHPGTSPNVVIGVDCLLDTTFTASKREALHAFWTPYRSCSSYTATIPLTRASHTDISPYHGLSADSATRHKTFYVAIYDPKTSFCGGLHACMPLWSTCATMGATPDLHRVVSMMPPTTSAPLLPPLVSGAAVVEVLEYTTGGGDPSHFTSTHYPCSTNTDFADLNSPYSLTREVTSCYNAYDTVRIELSLFTICNIMSAATFALKALESSMPLTGEVTYVHNKRFIVILMICHLTPVYAPPTRRSAGSGAGSGSGLAGSGAGSGSGSRPSVNDMLPNTQRDYDFLPGMKRWDGIPYYDFILVWWVALCFALGSITMSGVTLLDTAEGNDPLKSSTDPGEQREFKARSSRVFACIMNYIKPDCYASRYAEKQMRNDGPGLFKWLKTFGKLEYDPETKQAKLTEFEEMTMANSGIRFTPKAIWLWYEKVDEAGARLGKSVGQLRKKFLDGFPESFDSVITPERMKPDPGTYTIATHFPAHHPKAGQADPDANKIDMWALVTALEPEWTRRCRNGTIKPAPRGSVYLADETDDNHGSDSDDHDDDSDDHESAKYSRDNRGSRSEGSPRRTRFDDKRQSRKPHKKGFLHKKGFPHKKGKLPSSSHAQAVARSSVNDRMICIICGGRGHAGNVEGMDCLTKQLGISIPRDELAATKYPNGLKFPVLSNKKHAKQTEDVSQSDGDQDGNESSESGGSVSAKFAVTYHTINTSKTKYDSMSSDSEDNTPKPIKPSSSKFSSSTKSATTKAHKI